MKKKVNWENLWDQSMIKRARELGAAEFDWVLWDLARQNARAYRKREAIVDTFVGTAASEVRRKTWEEFFKDVNLMVFNLHDLGVRNRDIILTQVPNIIENVYTRVAVSKLGAIVVPGQVELGEAETKGLLELAQPKITIVVPSYHGRDIARWHVEYQRDHPSLEYIFAVTRPGEELPEGTEPFSELINPAIRDKYGDDDLDRIRPDPFDLYEFIPTGGTTGVPKLCMHSTYTMAQMH
ncbi:MAG: O-succinylbenzoate--CoA ligase, partial [Deltaproteobacteria bacterium]